MINNSPKPGMLNLFQERAKLCQRARPERALGRTPGGAGKATARPM